MALEESWEDDTTPPEGKTHTLNKYANRVDLVFSRPRLSLYIFLCGEKDFRQRSIARFGTDVKLPYVSKFLNMTRCGLARKNASNTNVCLRKRGDQRVNEVP